MKIDHVEIRYLESNLDKPFGWSQRWTDIRSVIVLKIVTDEGIFGWGETYGSNDSLDEISTICSMIIDQNPNNYEMIWSKLHRSFYQSHMFAKSGINAVSAIDTALLDIIGKSRKISVSEVLGGRTHESIPVYATGLYYVDDYALNPLLEEAQLYAEKGFTGMKMKVGALSLKKDAERIMHVRKTIGDNINLMFDANESYDPVSAIKLSKMVSQYDITWFEEPCASRDDTSNKLVQAQSDIPISGGESLSTRWEFSERISKRIFDIIQPDICSVGGITEMRKVGLIAQSFGVKFNPHFWGTGISFAAALHSLSNQPINQIGLNNFPYQNESVLEFDQTPHPIRDAISTQFNITKGSRVNIPLSEGLGIEINEDAVNHFTKGETRIVKNKSNKQLKF